MNTSRRSCPCCAQASHRVQQVVYPFDRLDKPEVAQDERFRHRIVLASACVAGLWRRRSFKYGMLLPIGIMRRLGNSLQPQIIFLIGRYDAGG